MTRNNAYTLSQAGNAARNDLTESEVSMNEGPEYDDDSFLHSMTDDIEVGTIYQITPSDTRPSVE